jgi:FkbM family methyltransferase
LKASRISLLDEPVVFYRQNRPGQISGRTDRRVFEVFTVFDRLHRALRASGAPVSIWSLVAVVQVRQFDWLLRDRVHPRDRHEFFQAVAQQLADIPESAFREFFRYAERGDAAKLFCLRHAWRGGYRRTVRYPATWALLLDVLVKDGGGRPRLAAVGRAVLRALRQRFKARVKRVAARVVNADGIGSRLAVIDARLTRLEHAAQREREPLVEILRVGGHELLVSRPAGSTLADSVRRVDTDHYLLRTAIFRPGDVVIDIGAHVGLVSLSLAKTFPFITVYALEPERERFECLQRNIELNGVTNVIALNKAIAGTRGAATLYCAADGSSFATIAPAFARSQSSVRLTTVETLTLDALFRDFDIRHCRVVKMTAPGVIRESLQSFTRDDAIDLLCGEVDVRDCSKAHLEAASWRLARQHFWRLAVPRRVGTVAAWIHDTAPTTGLRGRLPRDGAASD